MSGFRKSGHIYSNTAARAWSHNVLIHCNTVVRGLTKVYAPLPRARESVDMFVQSWVHQYYNIYIALLIVTYSIAHKYPGISTLQVRYYAAKNHHISLMHQKMRMAKKCSDSTISLTGLGRHWKAWIWLYPHWLIIYSRVWTFGKLVHFKYDCVVLKSVVPDQVWLHQLMPNQKFPCDRQWMGPDWACKGRNSMCSVVSLTQHDYRNH